MKPSLILCLWLGITCASMAQTNSISTIESPLGEHGLPKHSTYLTLDALFVTNPTLTANYEFVIPTHFKKLHLGIRTGVGISPVATHLNGRFTYDNARYSIPLTAKLYYGQSKHFWYLEGGARYENVIFTADLPPHDFSYVRPVVNIGYRYQSPNGRHNYHASAGTTGLTVGFGFNLGIK